MRQRVPLNSPPRNLSPGQDPVAGQSFDNCGFVPSNRVEHLGFRRRLRHYVGRSPLTYGRRPSRPNLGRRILLDLRGRGRHRQDGFLSAVRVHRDGLANVLIRRNRPHTRM